MTKQEMYDIAAAHLLKQGKKAEMETVGATGINAMQCRYRMLDPETGATLMCAIGCLIPDKVYSPEMENRNVWSLREQWPDLADEWPRDHSFLADLQNIHDAYVPDQWAHELRQFAENFGLTPYQA